MIFNTAYKITKGSLNRIWKKKFRKKKRKRKTTCILQCHFSHDTGINISEQYVKLFQFKFIMTRIKFSYKPHLSERCSEARYAFASGERMKNML